MKEPRPLRPAARGARSGRRQDDPDRPSARRFAPAVERALVEAKAFSRRPVGVDATLTHYTNRILPARIMQSLIPACSGFPGGDDVGVRPATSTP